MIMGGGQSGKEKTMRKGEGKQGNKKGAHEYR